MIEFIETTEIEADAATVWDILTGFERYAEWNPFIRWALGEAVEGARLRAYLVPPSGQPSTIHPIVVRVQPGKELVWRTRRFLPGLQDDEHSFRIKGADGGRIRFTNRLRIRGLLLPLFRSRLEATIPEGIHGMNLALKTWAENG